MAKLNFNINKPVGVDSENLTKVVNDIYDAINRLAKATNSYVSQSTEEIPAPRSSASIIKVVEEDDVKIKVKVDGEWYYTAALDKEN